MLLTAPDGPRALACCGPRALQLLAAGAATGYEPHGEGRPGVCCHTGAILRGAVLDAEHEAHDTQAVYDGLGAMLGNRRRSPCSAA